MPTARPPRRRRTAPRRRPRPPGTAKSCREDRSTPPDDHAGERDRDQTGDPRHRVVDRRADAALRRIDRREDRRRQRRHRDRQPEPEHDQAGQHLRPEVERRRAPSSSAGSRPRRSAGRRPCRAAGRACPPACRTGGARKNDSTGIGSVARPACVADMPTVSCRNSATSSVPSDTAAYRNTVARLPTAKLRAAKSASGIIGFGVAALPPRERDQARRRRRRGWSAPPDAMSPSRCCSMSAYTAPVSPTAHSAAPTTSMRRRAARRRHLGAQAWSSGTA